MLDISTKKAGLLAPPKHTKRFVDEMPNIVSGKAGAWYILPNGMGGDYTADMLFASKTYVDNGLQGKQDTLTAGEGISIQGTTISATGGGGNAWYGTQAEFEALQSVDTNTDYFISDPIDYSEIANTPIIPTMPTKMSQLANDEGFVTHHEMDNYVNATKIMKIVNAHNWYGTQAEYEALQTLNPDTNYHIEGDEVWRLHGCFSTRTPLENMPRHCLRWHRHC